MASPMFTAPLFVIPSHDMSSSISVLLIFRLSLIAIAPSMDMLLWETFSFNKVAFILMASAKFIIPSSVILLSHKLSSLSVPFQLRYLLMIIAPSSDM